ncbi:hypothetical protein ACIHEI_36675 [Kitasatospora sp. NPDC051984]|uniref:hypothetical protein n=1 Tax=Kitasatospora sp. NPDC051984 TaxID=3364059 RepID=UPI0037CC8368
MDSLSYVAITGPFQPAPYTLDEEEERALRQVREAGQEAARWMRTLAERQPEHAHAQALLNAAEAVEEATGAAVVPGGDGEALDSLHRSWLLASMVIGPAYHDDDRRTLPELTAAERLAVVAVCALAASMPGSVVGYCPLELDVLSDALAAAVRANRGD